MKSLALAGSALVALGVATGSLLAPQAASALDFTFSFGGVEGLITGLVDDDLNQCDHPSTCTVTVSVNTSPGQGTYEPIMVGGGFLWLSGGQLVSADWQGLLPAVPNYFNLIFLNLVGRLSYIDATAGVVVVGQNVVTFTPSSPPGSPVPGPLPFLGAAASFGFSRKLRNRIKVTRTTALTRPAG